MKFFLNMLILSCLLLGCFRTYEEKEVYKSNNLSVTQITGHVYRHISYLETEAFGRVACNGMIVVCKNEAVIFDTPIDDKSSLELIDWVSQKIKCQTVAVIATHYHNDNMGGLREFHRREIPSYAYNKTIQIAKQKGYEVPQQGFDEYFEFQVGDEIVWVEFIGEGHTVDNVIAYLPSENIMFGGCLVKELGAGKGNLADANVKAWPQTLKKLTAKYPNVRTIIPGHGKIGGEELLDYTITLFEGQQVR